MRDMRSEEQSSCSKVRKYEHQVPRVYVNLQEKAKGVGVWCRFVLRGGQMQIVMLCIGASYQSPFVKNLEIRYKRLSTNWSQRCLAG